MVIMKIDYSYISFEDNPKATAISKRIAKAKAITFFGVMSIFLTVGIVFFSLFGLNYFEEMMADGSVVIWILCGPVFSVYWLYTVIKGPEKLEKALNPDGLTKDQIANRLRENAEKANEYLRLDPSSPAFEAAAKSNNESPQSFLKKCRKTAETGQVNGSLARLQ